jgi:hypothetical protein
MVYDRAMKKLMLGALVLVAIAMALFFFNSEPGSNATPCEVDCINDSGGRIFCEDFCRKNGTYGPEKK